MNKTPKLTKCSICKTPYVKQNTTQKVCSYSCAIEGLKLDKEKKQRKADKEQKAKLMRWSDWVKKVDSVFNPYIRLRDAKDPCISCGRVDVEWTTGGAWDCGHYKSKAARPDLRYNELNSHKQCKSCNAGSAKYARKGHTVSNEYRERLVKKIGLEQVELLEIDPGPKKHSIPQLIELYEMYKQKLRTLK